MFLNNGRLFKSLKSEMDDIAFCIRFGTVLNIQKTDD